MPHSTWSQNNLHPHYLNIFSEHFPGESGGSNGAPYTVMLLFPSVFPIELDSYNSLRLTIQHHFALVYSHANQHATRKMLSRCVVILVFFFRVYSENESREVRACFLFCPWAMKTIARRLLLSHGRTRRDLNKRFRNWHIYPEEWKEITNKHLGLNDVMA